VTRSASAPPCEDRDRVRHRGIGCPVEILPEQASSSPLFSRRRGTRSPFLEEENPAILPAAGATRYALPHSAAAAARGSEHRKARSYTRSTAGRNRIQRKSSRQQGARSVLGCVAHVPPRGAKSIASDSIPRRRPHFVARPQPGIKTRWSRGSVFRTLERARYAPRVQGVKLREALFPDSGLFAASSPGHSATLYADDLLSVCNDLDEVRSDWPSPRRCLYAPGISIEHALVLAHSTPRVCASRSAREKRPLCFGPAHAAPGPWAQESNDSGCPCRARCRSARPCCRMMPSSPSRALIAPLRVT